MNGLRRRIILLLTLSSSTSYILCNVIITGTTVGPNFLRDEGPYIKIQPREIDLSVYSLDTSIPMLATAFNIN